MDNLIKPEINQESAQSFVEFSISFMILMALLAGLVDFGRAYFTMVSLRDASQEGALLASFNPDITDSEVIDMIVARALFSTSSSTLNVNTAGVDVEETVINKYCAGSSLILGENVSHGIKVTVTIPFEFTMPFMGIFIPSNSIPLSSTTYADILTPSCD